MRRRRLATLGLCLTLIPTLLTACVVAPGPAVNMSADQFWDGFSVISGAELNPAESLDELVSRSTLIVTGLVSKVTPGPVDVHEPGERDVASPSTILTIAVSGVIAGTPADEVKVWLSQENPSTSGVESLPADEFLWFLRPSDEPGLFHTTTLAGVIGVDSTGALVAFRDRGTGEDIIPPGVNELLELERLTALARQ